MADGNHEEPLLLPHHEMQSLCTTRLPYRQGRKLTAVKVYTVNKESNHLLIYGVPSLNLRQEAKALLSKFGKLLNFSLTTRYTTEPFTENYHATFDNIQSARIAKKMLDTKNFYGGSLHICYAPELESVAETRNKLFKRHKDVSNRIRNLFKNESLSKNKDTSVVASTSTVHDISGPSKSIINMGEINIIEVNKKQNKNKRKLPPSNKVIEKQFKPCYIENIKESKCILEIPDKNNAIKNSNNEEETVVENSQSSRKVAQNSNKNTSNSAIEVVDFTSTEKEILTNINEALNYNNFGNEIIRKIPQKPVNRIKFNVANKRL